MRTAADDTPWIVIGVPGADPGFVTISTADIHACLTGAGRAAQVDDIRLSAHSRGYKGLQETVRRRLIEVGKVSRVVAFDANYRTLVAALNRAGIPAARVTAYQVTPGGGGPLPMAGSRTINLSDIAGPLRAIAYVRLIQDAMITRPTLAIPPGVRAQLFPVPPPRTPPAPRHQAASRASGTSSAPTKARSTTSSPAKPADPTASCGSWKTTTSPASAPSTTRASTPTTSLRDRDRPRGDQLINVTKGIVVTPRTGSGGAGSPFGAVVSRVDQTLQLPTISPAAMRRVAGGEVEHRPRVEASRAR